MIEKLAGDQSTGTVSGGSFGDRRTAVVPAALRRWFVVHFVADVVFAVPLLLIPERTLRALGWIDVDAVSARLVGAALAGIGVESLLGRNGSGDSFRAMLRLKCIWSGAAVVGLALSIRDAAPPFTWVLLLVFAAFAGLWNYYRLRMNRVDPS